MEGKLIRGMVVVRKRGSMPAFFILDPLFGIDHERKKLDQVAVMLFQAHIKPRKSGYKIKSRFIEYTTAIRSQMPY